MSTSIRVYRFVNTEPLDAPLNMAIDEAILTQYLAGKAPPTLRTFRWIQTAITLGRFQNVEREIEQERCQQQGVALVRRPTGGRAVYHRDEFTYSLVIGKRENVPSGVVAAYAYLAQGLQAALQQLGISSELSEEHVSKNPSAACFASSTQADLTARGFKIIGSAQVWKDDGLLQQGSLPLDDRSEEFFSLLRFPTESARAEALALYQTKTTPLHTFVPDATREQVAQAFSTGFGKALQAQFVQEELSNEEWDMAQQLVEEKYNKLVWIKERITLV
jgi:lipoate-protein ligase A